MENILDFSKLSGRLKERSDYQCFWCQRAFKRRKESNVPAYCSYDCGASGQPEKVKRSISHTPGGQNQKS